MDQQGEFVLDQLQVHVDAVAGGGEQDVERVGQGFGRVPGEEEDREHPHEEGGGGDHEAVPQLDEVLHDREIGAVALPDWLLGPLAGVDDGAVADHVR